MDTDAFKIQSHLVFYDTELNSRQVVLGNAYAAFVETAMKMWAYARCLPRERRPPLSVFAGMYPHLCPLRCMRYGVEMLML